MARMPWFMLSVCVALVVIVTTGCETSSHAERGTLFGGALGAGTGALIGSATGNAGAGAAIGAGVGALSGAVVGSEIDDAEAKNRAAIAAQFGRQVSANAVSVDDVVAMSKAGVSEELILNHIRVHGPANTLLPADVIRLQQEGVGTQVIALMQTTPVKHAATTQTVVVREVEPQPTIIVERYDPYWGPPHHPHCW